MSVVLLLSRQRSGSGALASVLERHPDIVYAGEVLDPGSPLRPFAGWLASRGRDLRSHADLAEWFGEFLEELRAEPHINLVDIKYNCLAAISPPFHSFRDIPWILQKFSVIPAPVINIRRSPLETYVSAKLAEANGTFHAVSGSMAINSIHVDIADLANHMRISRLEDRFFDEFFAGYGFSYNFDYENSYEPDGRIRKSVLDGISGLLSLDFAGIDAVPRFVRQAPLSLAEKIANLEEVAAWLGREVSSRS